VRFWDSSALVTVCAPEPRSAAATALLEGDPDIMVWWGTRVECVSAVRRRLREGKLDAGGERRALARLDALARGWSEVAPSASLRRVAERLLYRHVLTAADALQLAAAMEWAGDDVAGAGLVTFDTRLSAAAKTEGFTAFPADG
jgi:predicted nucleic acid-binding protein